MAKVADVKKRLETRAPDAGITFFQMDGSDVGADEPHSFDLASYIGATRISGGHADTFEALICMVKPDGWVIVGGPHRAQQPSGDDLKTCGITRRDGNLKKQAQELAERPPDIQQTP